MEARSRPRLHARDHLPGGADPIDFSGIRIGSALPAFGDALFDLGCDHLWQFNEDTGTTAADAFGHADLGGGTGGSGSITWGSVESPPGTASVALDNGDGLNFISGKEAGFTGALPALTGTFSAGLWIYMPNHAECLSVMGQGTPSGFDTGGEINGWCISIDDSSFKPVLRAESGGFTDITGPSALANDTWYLVGLSQGASNDGTLYVNGANVASGTLDIGSAANIWFGQDGTFGYTGSLAFGFVFMTHALTDDEWAQLYASGYPFASDASVLTADGSGGTKWRTLSGTGGIDITSSGTEVIIDGSGGGGLTVYVDGA